jgi:hypothetical protein
MRGLLGRSNFVRWLCFSWFPLLLRRGSLASLHLLLHPSCGRYSPYHTRKSTCSSAHMHIHRSLSALEWLSHLDVLSIERIQYGSPYCSAKKVIIHISNQLSMAPTFALPVWWYKTFTCLCSSLVWNPRSCIFQAVVVGTRLSTLLVSAGG